MTDEYLKQKVRSLMHHNSKDGFSKLLEEKYSYVMPAPGNYPFQWWWDTCFHVFILCSVGEFEMAKKNLKSLFEMQQEDGFIGHMIFWESLLPHNKFNILQARPSFIQFRPHTSSLIQPPLVAQALLRICEETNDIVFLKMMLPKIKKYFHWLRMNRDFDGDGLISIISPFESGIDWKPSFDQVLGFKDGQANEKLFRKVIYVDLRNFLHRYHLKKIYKANYFIVKETMVNTMYALDMKALAMCCSYAGDSDGDFFKNLSEKVSTRIHELMFNETELAYFDVYGRDNKQLKALTFTIALPLLTGEAEKGIAEKIISKHFLNKSEFDLPYPVPSVAESEASFSTAVSKFLWRGPTWMITNWFLCRCFRLYGFDKLADKITGKSKKMIEEYGLREYYNPFTGEGGGATDFTWGGLIVDMIMNENSETAKSDKEN